MSFLIQLIANMALVISFVLVWMATTATAGALVGWAASKLTDSVSTLRGRSGLGQ